VQSGLKSNEVIWAIDKALSGEALEEGERESLASGSEILEGVGKAEGAGEVPEARRSQSMLGAKRWRRYGSPFCPRPIVVRTSRQTSLRPSWRRR
jgi:hypothetical protein